MDRAPAPSRSGKLSAKPDLYPTFVVHGNSDGSDEGKQGDDIYATMVYRNDDEEEEEEEEDSSLPPLLKRLPKDFGGGSSVDFDNDVAGDFGTMIVKTGGRRSSQPASSSSPFSSRKPPISYSDFNNSTLKKRIETFDDDEDDDAGGGFSTFVVKSSDKESVSGTVVRRSGFEDSTMGRAVASMQAVGEVGFGAKQQKKRTESSSSQLGEEAGRQHPTKISSSSIPDSVTREDPTIKYELLSELGMFISLNCAPSVDFVFDCGFGFS